jgi:hypothetical protein
MKTIAITFIGFLFSFSTALPQSGSLSGKVTDAQTGEVIPYVIVTLHLEKDQKPIQGTFTDETGYYLIDKIIPGIYSLTAAYVGYESYTLDSVTITSDHQTVVDLKIKESAMLLDEVNVTAFATPLIKKDQTTTGASVTAYNIVGLPALNLPANNVVYDDSGLLTASELNDFSKWSLWSDIRDNDLHSFQKMWGISVEERYMVQVTTEKGNPVIDAEVMLRSDKGERIWAARTDNTGKAELWNHIFGGLKNEKVEIAVISNGQEYRYKTPYPYPKGINALQLPVECDEPNNFEIAFVVDATGSMDDEITFLQSDLIEIMDKISRSFPGLEMSLGSVFYRCIGNSFTTKTSPLTTEITRTTDFIKLQSAGEGGDEAVEEALAAAVDSLGWSEKARSRIMFFILDEQPLVTENIIAKIHDYTYKAAERGIRIVPVVASAETWTHASSLEYLMRSIALATNGTYVFLTDHSKIGDAHAEPVTDKYEVELLNSLLKRIIYEYCYVPRCDPAQENLTISDTVFVSSRKIIAREVLDSLRTKDETTPRTYTEIFHLNLENKEGDTISAADTNGTGNGTRIEDREKEVTLKIYPNPTSGKFRVRVEGKIEEIYLFDLSGKLMEKFKFDTDNEVQIDISSYSTGIYFLKFLSGEKWYSGKVILKR